MAKTGHGICTECGAEMEIAIFSRKQIETFSFIKYEKPTALISITDVGWTFADLKNKPDYLLQLEFDDVDNDVFVDELGRKPTEEERIAIEKKYYMLTDEQARQIAEFYFNIADKAEVLICQCEHGQSRSAAVAAAIKEYRTKDGINIFADDNYYIP